MLAPGRLQSARRLPRRVRRAPQGRYDDPPQARQEAREAARGAGRAPEAPHGGARRRRGPETRERAAEAPAARQGSGAAAGGAGQAARAGGGKGQGRCGLIALVLSMHTLQFCSEIEIEARLSVKHARIKSIQSIRMSSSEVLFSGTVSMCPC